MTAFVLDTGALIALQRDRGRLRGVLRAAIDLGMPLRTTAPVLTEFIGASPRRLRPAAGYVASQMEVASVDEAIARRAAVLRQRALDTRRGAPGAIDALVATEAERQRGYLVISGDQADFEALAWASGAFDLIDLADVS